MKKKSRKREETQTIPVMLRRYHRGYRGQLTEEDQQNRGQWGTPEKLIAPLTLDGIVRAAARLLETPPARVSVYGLRTVSGGTLSFEVVARRRARLGRPARVTVDYLHSPLPVVRKDGPGEDVYSALPDSLESRLSPAVFMPAPPFTTFVALLRAADLMKAKFVYRRPKKTDWDRRYDVGHRFLMLSMRRRKPPTLAALRSALATARNSSSKEAVSR